MNQTRFDDIEYLYNEYNESLDLIKLGIKRVTSKKNNLDEKESGFITESLFLDEQKSILNGMKRELELAMEWMKTGYSDDMV